MLLVRHPPTTRDRSGWADPPLTARGKALARRTAATIGSLPLTRILTSDRRRAAYLARAIGVETALTPTYTKALRPWDVGTATPADLPHLVAHPDQPAPRGESCRAFLYRFLPVLERAVAAKGLIVLVTHYHNACAAVGWALTPDPVTIDPAPLLQPRELPPGAVVLLDRSRVSVFTPPER